MPSESSSSSSSSSSLSSSSASSSSSSSSDSSSSSFVPLSWPDLSKGLELDCREQPAGGDIAMRLGNGLDQVRPRFTRRRHRWRIALRYVTWADRQTLERFYLVDCARHKYSFEWTEPGLDQLWLVRWDPAAPPAWGHEESNPGKFRMQAGLVEDTAGEYGVGHYAELYYPNYLLLENGDRLWLEDETPILRDCVGL